MSRTEQLLALAPEDEVSRRAVGISCAVLLFSTLSWTVLCAGSTVLASFFTNPGLALVSATGAMALGLPYLLVILWLDRNEKEPWYLIVSSLAWGAIVATSISLLVNLIVGGFVTGATGSEDLGQFAVVSFSAPVIEELSKGLALIAIYLLFRHHLDNVLDGVIYGALVGLGFAVFENFIYYMNTGEVGTAVALICVRGFVTAVGSHACFTAITGAGVGLFRVQRQGALRWLLPPGALLLAMFVHFSWNTFYQQIAGVFASDITSFFVGLPLAVIVLQLPFVLLVLTVATFALRHETTLIRTYLTGESAPVIHPLELSYLIPARRRSLRSVLLVLQGRFTDYNLIRQRNDLLVNLAFEKWHMDREADSDPGVAREHAVQVESIRERLRALPEPPA